VAKDGFSYRPPFAAQEPFGGLQRQEQKEDGGEIPEVFGFARGDAGLGETDLAGQLAHVVQGPVAATGLLGDFLEQLAILLGV
jgi:hypothetical protein